MMGLASVVSQCIMSIGIRCQYQVSDVNRYQIDLALLYFRGRKLVWQIVQ